MVDPRPDPDLTRLLSVAHERVAHVRHDVDAVALYREAARAAERLSGPLGVAVAGVLAEAAERRRMTGLRGHLGCSNTMTALALAVLDGPPGG